MSTESRTNATTIDKLRQEFDKFLESAWSNGEKALDAFGFRPERALGLPCDIVETTDAVLVIVDLPGVDPAAVHVTLGGNMLTIQGERMPRPAAAGEIVHRGERAGGKFHRSIPLPTTVDPERVSADTRGGVLTVRLSKQASSIVRQIRVQDAEGTAHA